MMKAIIRLMMVAVLALAFAGSANAGIVNSKHDFSSIGAGSSAAVYQGASDQVCIYCHTPHNATEAIPLWNRSSGAGGYTLYQTSPTLTSVVKNAGALTSANISWKCLSCHDGSLATGDGAMTTSGGAVVSGATTNLGTDLSDDHPIGFDYDQAQIEETAAGLNTIGAATTAGVKFFGTGANTMECASCHDVHDAAILPKFTRINNAGSALCLACHVK